ncbi:MAG: glycosyltransferase, partial [Dokdonella sp.]
MSDSLPHLIRFCVHGAAAPTLAWLAALREQCDERATLVLVGTACDEALQADARVPELTARDPSVLADALANQYPDDDLVIVRSDAVIPAFALARLRHALEQSDARAIGVLDHLDPSRSPLPTDEHSDAEPTHIDGLVLAYGEHRLIDSADVSELMSVWIAASRQRKRRGFATVDHVYVGAFGEWLRGPEASPDPRDPAPPSPLAPLRRRVLAALSTPTTPSPCGIDGKPVLLHVLHGWGGGALRWVTDLASGWDDAHHLVLIARGSAQRRIHGEWLELRDARGNAPPLLSVPLPNPIADTALYDATWQTIFAGICRGYSVSAVVVSSLIGHSLDALRSGLPTLVVVHDHYPLWPALHRDFGDPALAFDAAQLQSDLQSKTFEFVSRDPAHWQRLRDAYVEAVVGAKPVMVAPSRSALTNQMKLAPEFGVLDGRVIAHGLAPWPKSAKPIASAPQRERLRLVVVGRLRAGKGGDLLTAALPGLRQNADLLLLGAGAAGHEFFGESGVHLVLDYDRGDLPERLAEWNADAALLLPTVAETYSYTYSELSSLGVPVIATRIGALAERIDDGRTGLLVEPSADAVIAKVAELARDRRALAVIRQTLVATPSISLEAMASDYRALFALQIGKQPFYPLHVVDFATMDRAALDCALSTAERDLAALQTELDDARQLAEQRGGWGHEVSRELGRSQDRIEQLQHEVAERTAWVDDIEQQLARSVQRATTIEAELAHDRARARERVAALEADIKDRTRWAERLDVELQERLVWVRQLEADIADLRLELEDRTAWALRLDAEVAEQRQQLIGLNALARDREAMLVSRSWRATEPLRRLTTWLRRVRLGVGYRRKRVSSALARTRGSMARRGLFATIRRAALELRRTPLHLTPMLDGEPSTLFEPFALPTSKRPRVSIVIPIFNKIEYTVACLRSLRDHAGAIPFEVIVVDDGSVDDTPRCLDQIDGVRSLRNRTNLGFVGSCNAGAALAHGEFVLFLNNDTVVTAGWLEALLNTFDQVPDAGLVGAKLVYPDGRLQEAGGIIFSDGSGWNYGRFDDPRDPRYCYRREVDYCSGAAIAIRRELFDRLGQFDRRYAPAYYEDTDLAFAVRAAGYKVIYQPAATVIHFEGITAGTDVASGVKQYQVVNREKFLAKWADALQQQPKPHPETPIGIAATHRAKRRALIIDATTPAPDQDSGSVRMVNLIRVLNDLGTQVSFMAENRAFVERDSTALQQLGVEVLYHPYVSDPVALFRERGHEWEVILLSRHYIAVNYVALVREYAPQARLLFDTVDLHYLREQREADLSDRGDLRRTARATRAQEIKVMRDCDVTLVVSPVEQELLRADAPDVRVEILSNVHEVFGCRKPFQQRHDLVFVGGFQHPPNIDAVDWFVKSVFPLIRPALPGVRFHIIGSKIIDDVLSLASDDVIVHGYVEDIAPFMDDSRISIAPLRYGAGVKGKVNMAMSYGLPVVATPIAVEGMHVRIGEDVLVAPDAEGLADEIVRLYSDDALWNQLSANGL